MQEHLALLHRALGPDSGLVLVGGAVRDLLLGRSGGDWDLASRLLPEVARERLEAAGLRVIPTGLQHGTITVLSGPHAFELTTFRGDGPYSDGRRPDSIELGVDLEADLARRDFTVNALALPAERVGQPDWRDHLIDPFGGRQDLASKRLKAVGDPLLRFSEDGLRPLRACRFMAQLGFHLEAATRAAIPHCLEVSRRVAVERVMVELTKLLSGPQPGRGMDCLLETGLMGLWLVELLPLEGCHQNRHHAFDAWNHTLAVLAAVPPDPALRWAALLHDAGKPATRVVDAQGSAHFHGHEAFSQGIARTILERLKAPGSLSRTVLALVARHGEHPEPTWSDAACRRFLRRLLEDGLDLETWASFREGDLRGKGTGVEAALEVHQEILDRLRSLLQTTPPLSTRQLALDGRALMRLAARPGGPWLGELQQHLLDLVIDHPDLNTAEVLEAIVKSKQTLRQHLE